MRRTMVPLTLALLAPAAAVAAPPAPFLDALVPGETTTITMDGVTPGATVLIFWGTAAEPGTCPPQLDGDCFDIAGGGWLASGIANGSGVLTVQVDVPPTTPLGFEVWLQAVQMTPGPFLSGVSHAVAQSAPNPCEATSTWWSDAWAQRECQVVAAINTARATPQDCGTEGTFDAAPPLMMTDALRVAARAQTWWIADTGTLSHRSPGGPLGTTLTDRVTAAGYGSWSRIAENIGRGHTTVSGLVTNWLNSDGHCANLMGPGLEDIGVGHGVDSRGRPIWTAVFGAP